MKESRFAGFSNLFMEGKAATGEKGPFSGGRAARMRGAEAGGHPIVCNGGDTHRARIALDVGIVCPQVPAHRDEAAKEVLGAAEAYTRAKASHNQTEARVGRRLGVPMGRRAPARFACRVTMRTGFMLKRVWAAETR